MYYYPQDQKPPVTATRQHKNAEQGNDKGDKEIKPSEGMEILIQRHGLIPMKCNNYTFFSMPCRLCDYRVKRHYNMPKHLTQHVNHCKLEISTACLVPQVSLLLFVLALIHD